MKPSLFSKCLTDLRDMRFEILCGNLQLREFFFSFSLQGVVAFVGFETKSRLKAYLMLILIATKNLYLAF